MSTNLSFAPLEAAHLPGAMRLSAEVGWPHRLEDWSFVAGISNGVVALLDGQVVATALATPFGEVAMANLIIVDAALRGRGLGRDIMGRAMETVSPAAWQLVATQEGVRLYEKLGFETFGAVLQHQGQVRAGVEAHGDAQWDTTVDLGDLLKIDTEATGMDRRSLYRSLNAQARFAVLRQDGRIFGFAAVRPFGRGAVAGPIVAQSMEGAQSLLSLVMSDRAGQFLRVDTGAQTGLAPWLAQNGLAHAGRGLQMQKGVRSERAASSFTVYGLASQALG